jgi:L-threonylcarbamoyladenylate synthase
VPTEILLAEIVSADRRGVRRAAKLLHQGEVIGFPTDTVYGLAAFAGDPRACDRVFEIKKRDRAQQLIMMAARLEALEDLVEISDRARVLMSRWWPGPLTLVLPAKKGSWPTLGVRIPDHGVALQLLEEVGEPLATTSANLSSQPPAMTAIEVAHLDGVAAVLDGGAGPGGQPSTVLSLVGSSPTLIRPGPIPKASLLGS